MSTLSEPHTSIETMRVTTSPQDQPAGPGGQAEADRGPEADGGHRADHEHVAVGEVDELDDPVDERVADRDERPDGAVGQPLGEVEAQAAEVVVDDDMTGDDDRPGSRGPGRGCRSRPGSASSAAIRPQRPEACRIVASGRAAGAGRVGVNECASTRLRAVKERGRTRRPLSHPDYFALTVLVGVIVLKNTGSPLEPTL